MRAVPFKLRRCTAAHNVCNSEVTLPAGRTQLKLRLFCLLPLFVSLVLSAADTAPGQDAPKTETAATTSSETQAVPSDAASALKPTEFKDPDAGYVVTIPAGYSRLSDDRVRMAFKGASSYLGKDVSERALVKPPACFQGPVDPLHPKTLPPGLAIGFSALSAPVDPAQMSKYKEDYEQELKKSGESAGDVSVDVVSVNGIPSLRIEHDIFSPIDNTRSRMIKLSVPGQQRRYDIVFSFFNDQAPQVKDAMDVVMKSFATTEIADPNAGRWMRVALWTVGGLVAGVLLGALLGALAGKKTTPANA